MTSARAIRPSLAVPAGSAGSAARSPEPVHGAVGLDRGSLIGGGTGCVGAPALGGAGWPGWVGGAGWPGVVGVPGFGRGVSVGRVDGRGVAVGFGTPDLVGREVGDGDGQDVSVGVGVGDGVSLGDEVGDGVSLGDGVGDGVSLGDGVGVGDGGFDGGHSSALGFGWVAAARVAPRSTVMTVPAAATASRQPSRTQSLRPRLLRRAEPVPGIVAGS
jgi:hypothetical protein